MLIDVLKLHLENAQSANRDRILFFQDLSSQIHFSINFLFLWALQEFQQDLSHQHTTYTAIIANPVSNFLMKMHEHIRLFTYPSFSKYSLRRLYHMCLDCFNPYKGSLKLDWVHATRLCTICFRQFKSFRDFHVYIIIYGSV